MVENFQTRRIFVFGPFFFTYCDTQPMALSLQGFLRKKWWQWWFMTMTLQLPPPPPLLPPPPQFNRIPHYVLRIFFTGVNALSVTQYNAAICHLHLQQNKTKSNQTHLVLSNTSLKIDIYHWDLGPGVWGGGGGGKEPLHLSR